MLLSSPPHIFINIHIHINICTYIIAINEMSAQQNFRSHIYFEINVFGGSSLRRGGVFEEENINK